MRSVELTQQAEIGEVIKFLRGPGF